MARRLISTGKLAELLGVTTRTIERWVEDGLIDYEMLTAGGHYRFDADKVIQRLRDLRPRDEE